MDISRRAQTFVWCIPVPEHTATHKLSALATKVVTAAGAVYAAGMDAKGDFVVSCGHDPRRCCDDCCPAEEEGSNGHGGGCNKCSSAQGLVLPRVGEGILGIQVAVIVDAMLEEVKEMDDREVAEALRFVLHVTRGDPFPKTFESMLD